MKEKYNVRFLEIDEWGLWNEWVTKQIKSSPYSYTWWLEEVCRIFGGTVRVVVAQEVETDKIVAGIAFRYIEVLKKYKIIMPCQLQLYMPLVLIDEVTSQREISRIEMSMARFLNQHFNEVLKVCNTVNVEDLRGFKYCNYDLEVNYTAMSDMDEFDLSTIGRSNRKLIKRAVNSGYELIESDNISEIWEMLCKTAEKKRFKLKVSFEDFNRFYSKIKEKKSGQAYVVLNEDKMAISFVIAVWSNREVAYGWVGGTLPEYYKKGASVFMFWKTLSKVKEMKYRFFDWCGANIESVANFKVSFGAKIKPYYVLNKNSFMLKCLLGMRKKLRR